MIITHEKVETNETSYGVRKINGSLDSVNYFPSMYDYDTRVGNNLEIIDESHVVIRGYGTQYKIYQPPSTTGMFRYSFMFRTTEDRPSADIEGEGGFTFSFVGLEIARGHASYFPSDGEWYEYSHRGSTLPETETITFGITVGSLSSPTYEIKNMKVTFGEPPTYDYFNGDTPDYSANPPLVYHDGEWVEYIPKLYI